MRFRGTTVTFYRRSDDRFLTGYTCSGHTGYAEAGQDIVCAGISALTQSTLNGLLNVLKAPVMYEVDENAFVDVRLTPEATPDQIEKAQLLLETMFQGIQAIERGYPRNVKIEERFSAK